MRSCALILVSVVVACGGKPTPAPVPPTPPPNKPSEPPPAPPDPVVAHEAHDPEFYPPPWKKVGVGQTIYLSTAVIDQDLDETVVDLTKKPASATFDPITQTITWTPTKAELGEQEFDLQITQPGHGKNVESFSITVTPNKQPAPALATQSPVIEELLLVHDPKRLDQVNKDWPLTKLLEIGADTFRLQFSDDHRKLLTSKLDGKTSYEQMLTGLAQIQNNPRLDPKAPEFDKKSFGDPARWRLVAFRPRIDKAWTELRVVYQAVDAPEPVFAMFRLRPVVEYVPALPRPEEERTANNKIFLGMVAKHLMDRGGPSQKLLRDPVAHGKAISALMTDIMMFDDTKTAPYLHGFEIGIALEARMGGGSARNADGTYQSGDGWGWSAMKPFQTSDGTAQAYVNVAIPGFWTRTAPSDDKSTWIPVCAPRFNPADPHHVPGYQVLCRKTIGFVDLPDTDAKGKIINGKREANNLYKDYKLQWSQQQIALEDGRRDLGEENGMTCSQCHIRNFGMHDFSDAANVDPKAGEPKAKNHELATLNFQIIPTAQTASWEPFTLEFLDFQECRGKVNLETYLGADAAKGLTCPLAHPGEAGAIEKK
nr:Ig domain-containing protein [Kofleriaceae bacterium]